jgi:hypothetical protein
MDNQQYKGGANPSSVDIRDFKYIPDLGVITAGRLAGQKGGARYLPEDIENQHHVGICTAIGLTQNARKALGKKFSADFQYLMQKMYFDKNWDEGSSPRAALTIGKNIGFLPAEEWKHTTEKDRKLSYSQYIAKLKAIPAAEIERLKLIAADYKLQGYAPIPVNRNDLALAIDESKSGLIVRFVLDNKWWQAPIEPLRAATTPISGHETTLSNYDGNSYRIANEWGSEWADGGTAYGSLLDNPPTEAWIPYYNPLPIPMQVQKEKLTTLQGQLIALLQQLVSLLGLKK